MPGLLPSSRSDLYNNAKARRGGFFKTLFLRKMQRSFRSSCSILLLFVPMLALVYLAVAQTSSVATIPSSVLSANGARAPPLTLLSKGGGLEEERNIRESLTGGHNGTDGTVESDQDVLKVIGSRRELGGGRDDDTKPKAAKAVTAPAKNTTIKPPKKLERQWAFRKKKGWNVKGVWEHETGGEEGTGAEGGEGEDKKKPIHVPRKEVKRPSWGAWGGSKRPVADNSSLVSPVLADAGKGGLTEGAAKGDLAEGVVVKSTGELGEKGVEKGVEGSEEKGKKKAVRPPDLQFEDDDVADKEWAGKQRRVVEAFEHAWKGYRTFALGFDELKPESRKGENSLGGLGATVVDALDTAMIMGLGDVVEQAGQWIQSELGRRFEEKGQVNLFETTIRVLGGLLSAYYLRGGRDGSEDTWGATGKGHMRGPKPEVYLNLAQALADRLMVAFESSPTPIPYSDVFLSQRLSHPSVFDGGASSTAECTTLQLEFWYLSYETGDPKYGEAAMRVLKHFKNLPKSDGLVPIYINPHNGQFQGNNIRLGSRGDSYYEYLVKVWMQQGGAGSGGDHVQWVREMYDVAMHGVKKHLVAKSVPGGLTYIAELQSGIGGGSSPKMDHLVCFLGGSLALGATHGLTETEAKARGELTERDIEDLELAKELTRTCYQTYAVTATGLAPEITYFNTQGEGAASESGGKPNAPFWRDLIIQPNDRHNLLRPETVEALFYLHRTTKDPKYREWGWEIFQAFEKFTKVESGGYTSLSDVTRIPPTRRDKMETFFLGETLKYLYLLFSPSDLLPLSDFVFNTEAHPLPIIKAGAEAALDNDRGGDANDTQDVDLSDA